MTVIQVIMAWTMDKSETCEKTVLSATFFGLFYLDLSINHSLTGPTEKSWDSQQAFLLLCQTAYGVRFYYVMHEQETDSSTHSQPQRSLWQLKEPYLPSGFIH